jgi:hypothetical protein
MSLWHWQQGYQILATDKPILDLTKDFKYMMPKNNHRKVEQTCERNNKTNKAPNKNIVILKAKLNYSARFFIMLNHF